METGILQVKEYGRIRITLRQHMEQLGITRNRMARMIDVRYEVIDKWYKGNVERIDADILARLCFVLKCAPGELLQYVPGDDAPVDTSPEKERKGENC